jgi:hypothetical protein
MTTHCVTLCYAHCHQNRVYQSSLPLARDHTKIVSEVHKLHLGQRLGQHIRDLLICGNALELHSSLLHHIADILIFDLYVLGLVMKHWIFGQLYATLVVTINTSSIHL